MAFDAGSWLWSREPGKCESRRGGLTWRCDGGSDVWRLTSSGAVKDDGNAYLGPVGTDDFAITGRFDAVLVDQYDQVGMLVDESPESWLKAGGEVIGEPKFSVVRTTWRIGLVPGRSVRAVRIADQAPCGDHGGLRRVARG